MYQREEIPGVSDGVFFTSPERLPRGPHKLSREQVKEAQAERLLAAMTELLAAYGYRGFGPGDIARRAGVSLAAFYALFENKEACVFAGYDRFIEVLLRGITSVDVEDKDRLTLVGALLGAYLETLQSDLVVARAYQVEIDALGLPARERRRASLTLFADFIQGLVARLAPEDQEVPDLPSTAYLGVVYAARQLASDRLDDGPEPDLSGLRDELEVWLTDLFRDR